LNESGAITTTGAEDGGEVLEEATVALGMSSRV